MATGKQFAFKQNSAYVQLLRVCAKNKDLEKGTQLHVDIEKNGMLVRDPYIASSVIHMYAKCSALTKAQQVFEKLYVRDVVSWNTLLAGFAQCGQGQNVINYFGRMQREGVTPDEITYTCLLNACGSICAVAKGKKIHDDIISRGFLQDNIILGNALVDMYAKCGMLSKASDVLKDLPARNSVTWNALIAGYVQYERSHEALDCMVKMQRDGISPNAITFTCILNACAQLCDLGKGEQIHKEIKTTGLIKGNILLCSALVDMYAKCGALVKAQQVLDEISVRNVVCWNALIAGYIQHQQPHEALDCFERLQREGLCPDEVTFTCILKACGNLGATERGMQIHNELAQKGWLLKSIVLGNALMDMYAKCGQLVKTRQVLEELPARDTISWNTIIAGYAQDEQGHEALNCFSEMQKEGICPDEITFACTLKACGSTRAIEMGKQVHGEIVSKGLLAESIELGNSLIHMYAKSGSLSNAQEVLENLPVRNVVSWNALIAGFNQHERGQDALDCFTRMQMDGLSPNEITYVCILKACANIGAVNMGVEIHEAILNWDLLKENAVLGTALVALYAKCGVLPRAQQVLEGLHIRDMVSWSALIAGYAQDGRISEALDCFERMKKEGLYPDDVTFVSVLNACSHSGKLSEAEKCYEHMRKHYGVIPKLEHHTCMVVIFGSAGRFDKAMSVIKASPFSEHPSLWLALLSACRRWGNVKLGRLVFEQAIHLDTNLTTAYVVMANIYAAAGMSKDVLKLNTMKMNTVENISCYAIGQSTWDEGSYIITRENDAPF